MVAFSPTIKGIIDGADFVSGLSENLTWLYALPDQNWFQIACLIAAPLFIWKAAREVDEQQAARLSAETIVRSQIAEIPILQARIASFDRDLAEFDRDLIAVEKKTEEWARMLAIAQSPQTWRNTEPSPLHQRAFITHPTPMKYRNFAVTREPITVQAVSPFTETGPTSPMLRADISYDPSANGAFIFYHQQVVVAHEAWLHHLREERTKVAQERHELEFTLDEKLKAYAGSN